MCFSLNCYCWLYIYISIRDIKGSINRFEYDTFFIDIRITTSYGRKTPGDEPYSSESTHLTVEIELPDRVLTDQQQFTTAVRRLFQQARDEVEHQVDGRRETQHPSNGDGRQPSNGNGGRAQPASAKQIDFLLSLGRRNANLSPAQILQEAGVEKLTDLTRSQASALIDRFNGAAR